MHEVRIPKLGLDTLECEIKSWHVKVGDSVAPGTTLLDVESEKAVIAIEAEVSGAVREIRASAGETVPVGSVVGIIEQI